MSEQALAPVTARIEAELVSAAVSLQVLQMNVSETFCRVLQDDDAFRFDLSLTPRLHSGLCFADHWAATRFERPGKLFVVPPTEKLCVRSGTGSQKAVVCSLRKEVVAGYIGADFEWTDERLEASLDVSDPALVHILRRMGEEARNPGLASDVLCDAMAIQLAVDLYRTFCGIAPLPRSGGLSPTRLALIRDRLESDTAPPTLVDLAKLCGLSVRQLARAFRESQGIPIGAYIATYRIARAKELLASGANLKTVSHQLGFASPSSFCQAFRKSTGWTPGAFQHQQTGRRRAH